MSGKLKRTNTIWPGTSASAMSLRHSKEHEETNQSAIQDTPQDISLPSKTDAPTRPQSVHISEDKIIAAPLMSRLLNRHMVPTSKALSQSIVVTPKSIWDLYEAIEFCYNQGESGGGHTALSRRRKSTHKDLTITEQDKLFVVKQQRWSTETRVRHCVKPACPYLVELYSAFCKEDVLWTLYEEMEMALEQIFELDCSPWSIEPSQKNAQIAAISLQVIL